MNINLSPARTIDISTLKNDLVYFPFQVITGSSSTSTGTSINFTGFTAAKLSLRLNELTTPIISFTNTGSTYQIDISKRNLGKYLISCNSLAIDANTYQYDFQISNNSQRLTLMKGKFVVIQDITI